MYAAEEGEKPEGDQPEHSRARGLEDEGRPRAHAQAERRDRAQDRTRLVGADGLQLLIVLALLAAPGCATSRVYSELEREMGIRALHPPPSMTCLDGRAVKLLVGPYC